MQGRLSISAKLALFGSALFGLLYLALGLLWLVQPAVVSAVLGASLLSGSGLSTQLGDSASFFLCAGGLMLYGVASRSSGALMVGGLLIGLVAPVRIIAWLAHDAALTLEPIIIEVVTFLVLFAAARCVRSSERGVESS